MYTSLKKSLIIIFFGILSSKITKAGPSIIDIGDVNINNCYKDPQNNIMQSFFINETDNSFWISFDSKERQHQIIKLVKEKSATYREDYEDINSTGHLDSFYVENFKIISTDKYIKPSIIKMEKGKIISRADYPIKIYGNQIIAFDKEKNRDFVLWASDDNKNKYFFLGQLDHTKFVVSNFKKTSILYPKNEILQGLGLYKKFIYALTGDKNNNPSIYKWNASGKLISKRILSINSSWRAEGYFEPEGLNITGDNLAFGLVTKQSKNGDVSFFNCIKKFKLSNF